MDTLDAFLRLHYAAGNAGWLRKALRASEPGDAAGRSPLALLEAPASAWFAEGAPLGARAEAWSAAAEAHVESVRRWLARDPAHAVLAWCDADYPSLLREMPNPPTALYLHGAAECLWWPQIAVVGSRSPTPAGRERAARWAAAFAEAGFVVTSGLAAGVDAAAHAAALEVARSRGSTADGAATSPATIAVTGTGPDRCFPAAHRALQAAVAAGGCVVTEHPPGMAARAEHFPSRNRIIAGLSLATVVVEAAQRSGALITARLAAEAGREVFAIPGAPENLKAKGCHRLIRDGAVLVDEPSQVIEAVAEGAAGVAGRLRRAIAVAVSGSPDGRGSLDGSGAVGAHHADAPGDSAVRRALGTDGASFDALLLRTGLTSAALAPILIGMELEGRLTQQHGVYLPRG